MADDLYDTLGVPTDASPEDIKAAYRSKAKQHHPDAGGDAERFGELQKAFDILFDAEKRSRYDRTGSTDTMDRSARIEAMAAERLGAMVVEILQGPEHAAFQQDWIAVAKRQAQADRRRFLAEQEAIKAKIALAERLAKRFKSKAPRNIPGDILSHVKRDMHRGLEQLAEKLEVVDRLEKLLADYSFEADPPPTANSFFDAYQTTTGNIFGR